MDAVTMAIKAAVKEQVKIEIADFRKRYDDNNRWLSAKQAYERMGISRTTFFQWRKDGTFRIQPSVVGDLLRYDRNKIDKFMEAHE